MTSILAREQSLIVSRSASDGDLLFLPFMVGAKIFSMTHLSVSRVTIPIGVAPLPRYKHIPACIVGVASGTSEMLTVVDLGLLFDSLATQSNMKTRLIVMAGSELRGYALLVSRVLDLTPVGAILENKEIKVISACDIRTKLMQSKLK